MGLDKPKSETVVFVGLSGGVDSGVTAELLKEEGYDVRGVFMKNFSGEDFGIADQCPWEEDQRSAMEVAKHLDIPFRTYNFEKQYRQMVVDYFFEEFAKGRTPNPDVMCNKTIKFDVFLQRALEDGADMIATGHYARVVHQGEEFSNLKDPSEIVDTSVPADKHYLLKGTYDQKDQTYFLNTFTQEQLEKVLFPIGHLTKPEVRKLGEKFGLPNFDRPDSQGICFIGEIDLVNFLKSQIPEKQGEIRDADTDEVIGEHEGVYFYTIGQRRGLNLGGFGVPYFVSGKDVDRNILYAAKGSRNPKLFKSELRLESTHFIEGELSPELAEKYLNKPLTASIRYRQTPQPGKFVKISADESVFIFEQPQRAITEGQSLVAFDGDICLGGGVIGA